MNKTIRRFAPAIGLALFYGVVMALRKTEMLTSYYVQIIMFALINSMVTVGLNLINGFTGQFSIGQAGFVAVGAYVSGVVTTLVLPTNLAPFLRPVALVAGVLAGGVAAGLCGYLIGRPSLRLKGDYLAIVTLAFGEIIRSAIRMIPQVGGPRGFYGIPRYSNLFWIVLFFGLTIYAMRNFLYSSYGRACVSCREDELASETMGVDTTRYKVMAFTVGSAMAGVAGGLLAHLLGYLHPDQFNYLRSIDFLVYLYAGGVGSITGSIIGASLLTVIPEMLRFLAGWRLVIYGVVLVLLMLFRSQGIFGGRELTSMIPVLKRKPAREGGSANA